MWELLCCASVLYELLYFCWLFYGLLEFMTEVHHNNSLQCISIYEVTAILTLDPASKFTVYESEYQSNVPIIIVRQSFNILFYVCCLVKNVCCNRRIRPRTIIMKVVENLIDPIQSNRIESNRIKSNQIETNRDNASFQIIRTHQNRFEWKLITNSERFQAILIESS